MTTIYLHKENAKRCLFYYSSNIIPKAGEVAKQFDKPIRWRVTSVMHVVKGKKLSRKIGCYESNEVILTVEDAAKYGA